MIQIDNLEELTKGLSDREYTSIWTDINNIIMDEIDRYEGFIRNFKMICIPLPFLVVHFMRWRKTVLKCSERIRKVAFSPSSTSYDFYWY